MKKNNKIEKLFRKSFSGYEETPSENVWKRIRQKLWWNNFVHFRWNSFNIFYLAGILLLGFAAWLVLSNDQAEPRLTDQTEAVVAIDTTGEKSKKRYDQKAGVEEKKDAEKPSFPQKSSPEITKEQKQKDESEQKQVIKAEPDIRSTIEEEKPVRKEPDSVIREKVLPPEPEEILTDTVHTKYTDIPKAFFVPSAFEGCVPLQIRFENNSPGATAYEWSFGDGGNSVAENPIYIFDEPGNYFVTLTAHGEGNLISTYSEIITVHPNPKALFEMDIENLPGNGKTVYFYNYSRGAEKYLWTFDEGAVSELDEPTKIFETQENPTIKLIAISDKGCKDSMIMENAFSVDEPEMVFPNAFTPNPDGPTGGYYSDNRNYNDVFHPFMPEDPVEYTFRIFNKNGNLIFESNDPSIGWDGYYLQELQPQGVYIYKVKARFRKGKQIVKMGDVTLIHEERW